MLNKDNFIDAVFVSRLKIEREQQIITSLNGPRGGGGGEGEATTTTAKTITTTINPKKSCRLSGYKTAINFFVCDKSKYSKIYIRLDRYIHRLLLCGLFWFFFLLKTDCSFYRLCSCSHSRLLICLYSLFFFSS